MKIEKLTPNSIPRYAPVVPLNVAMTMKTLDLLGNYHLLLAHDVVAHPEEYEHTYKDPDNFIIMDNSVVELGDAVDASMLREACNIVDADVLVLPDVLMDGPATVHSSLNAFYNWNFPSKLELMVIPQGNTIKAWHSCFNEIMSSLEKHRLHWIGIPKNYNEKLGGSRLAAVNEIIEYNTRNDTDILIHLFGFSNDWKDDLETTVFNKRIVTGIDSASPVWMGLRGVSVLSDVETYESMSRGNFWEQPYDQGMDWKQVEENITTVRQFLAQDHDI